MTTGVMPGFGAKERTVLAISIARSCTAAVVPTVLLGRWQTALRLRLLWTLAVVDNLRRF